MTEAAIINRLEVNDPVKEVVVVDLTDGLTYISKKFAVVQAVQATFNEDTANATYPISCAVSGGTVTMHCQDLSTARYVCLTLYGRK